METLIEEDKVVDIVGNRRLSEIVLSHLQISNLPRRRVLHSEAGNRGVDKRRGLKEIAQRLVIHRRDGRTAIAHDANIPLARQLPEDIAKRRPRNSEFAADGGLVEIAARLQIQRQYSALQGEVDFLPVANCHFCVRAKKTGQ